MHVPDRPAAQTALRAIGRVLRASLQVWTVGVVVLCASFVALAVTGRRVEVVLSHSMEPTIAKGSAVLIDPVDDAKLARIEVGDIIAFQAPGREASTIHRVVQRTDAELGVLLQTAGDGNLSGDLGSVQPGQITGVVNTKIPYIGPLLRASMPPSGLVLLLGVPMMLWTGMAFVDGRIRRRSSPPLPA